VSDNVSLSVLGVALLRAASEGRLHRLAHIYRWRPRNAVTRSIGSPGISETGAQLHAFGLISHHESDTTCALTERGREALAAHQEKGHPRG
jgi:cellulase/cellobiase CelA1